MRHADIDAVQFGSGLHRANRRARRHPVPAGRREGGRGRVRPRGRDGHGRVPRAGRPAPIRTASRRSVASGSPSRTCASTARARRTPRSSSGRAGSRESPPTDIVCDDCFFRGGAYAVRVNESVRSGVRNSTVCNGKFGAVKILDGARGPSTRATASSRATSRRLRVAVASACEDDVPRSARAARARSGRRARRRRPAPPATMSATSGRHVVEQPGRGDRRDDGDRGDAGRRRGHGPPRRAYGTRSPRAGG